MNQPPTTTERPPMTLRLGIRARLVLSVVAALSAVVGITATVVVMRAEAALSEVDEERFLALTAQMADAARVGALAKSELLLKDDLAQFVRYPALVELTVVDEKGSRLFFAQGPAADSRHGVTTSSAILDVASDEVTSELSAFGVDSPQDTPLGEVHARFSRGKTRRIEAGMRRDMLVAFWAAATLAVVLLLWLFGPVIARVRTLAAAASKVAAGERDVRVTPEGSDEVADLMQQFDAMTLSLDAQRREIENASAQLAERESLAAIGRATAVIAHELKNPLGILLGAAEVLQKPDRKEAVKREALEIIVEEIPRLERTLTEVLDFARPRPLALSPVALGPLLEKVRDRALYRGGPLERGAVDIHLPDDIGPVFVDAFQIEKVLLNLLLNAGQAGGQHVTVQVVPDDELVAIHIKDDGPGIDDKVRVDLFQPFVTTKQRGSGLGLAVARRAVRAHGGDLWAEAADEGAHFVLTLPRAAGRMGEEEVT